MSSLWSWERAFEAIPLLLEGFQITLLATVLGMVIAAILGLAIAILRRSRFRWISMPVGWINEFIRQTPLLVQLVFAYYLFTSCPRSMGSHPIALDEPGAHLASSDPAASH
jgi:polar amino acid transport system permease protein